MVGESSKDNMSVAGETTGEIAACLEELAILVKGRPSKILFLFFSAATLKG